MTARRFFPTMRAVLAVVATGCGAGGGDPGDLGAHAVPPLTELEARGVKLLDEPEYRATLAALLGEPVASTTKLAPAPRQRGFSRNAARVVDAHSLGALHDFAAAAAGEAVRTRRIAELAACEAALDRACALRFVPAFGRRAFRRPLTELELERYLALYDAGAEGASPLDGLELVVRTMLQSPWFLYATALGDAEDEAPAVRLTSHELASALSYAIAGAPPDGELAALADRDALRDARAREREARRLFRQSATRFHYRRFAREWLELDRLEETAKDLGKYPDFVAGRADMSREADEFVDRAMIEANGAFAALVAGASDDRRGLLEFPAFLTVHAHPASSAPVLRGAAVLERVLCREFPTPNELGIEVTAPPPDPGATTRERFEAHASDPACAGCHAEIDPLGGTFEGFGAVGERRTDDGGRPVDTSGHVTLDGVERALSSSGDLALALAASDEARHCFARQAFRYLSSRDDDSSERAFADDALALDATRRSSLVELAVRYVASERFAWRRSER